MKKINENKTKNIINYIFIKMNLLEVFLENYDLTEPQNLEDDEISGSIQFWSTIFFVDFFQLSNFTVM